ncbi:DUF4013 domain-containing protein [Candidatus Woesearchaeota archaeon]|jgi:hypothetical protein|nr:DUF4013 domain-containing protein [Candidatus Woesearchaeota archaeon]MBT4368751.1 DUF4013 domain-containing protein [Candidatus Woesearchaeota archaeon]MBT4712040.1 DUF4013 domain-containing protein [Candidatus Woesearchaeota archaeon]MBT6639212.1 DUF4013 domain-containing protein [Candidatus Woesearchaeota archaeon]MBT7134412.1 DUF4013 domain-containing protein [Candidatus Woesearchaeota archaeon]
MHYSEALKRPFTDFRKLILGILLTIVPIVNFFALGYVLECARTANRQRFKLPEWDQWGEKFVNGFFMVVIGFVYFIPAAVYAVLAFGTVIINVLEGKGIEQLIASSAGLVIIGVIILLITAYVFPSAILSFGFSKKLGKAFNINLVFKRAFTARYFKAWIVGALTYLVIALALGGIKGLSPAFAIQQVGNAIISFVGGTIFYTVIGEDYK